MYHRKRVSRLSTLMPRPFALPSQAGRAKLAGAVSLIAMSSLSASDVVKLPTRGRGRVAVDDGCQNGELQRNENGEAYIYTKFPP